MIALFICIQGIYGAICPENTWQDSIYHCDESFTNQVQANDQSLIIYYCKFTGVQVADKDKGGAICLTFSETTQSQNQECKIFSCEFKSCKNLIMNGGAVWIESKSASYKITFDFNTFDSNSAANAGCALYLNAVNMEILHCKFINNNNEQISTVGSDIYFIFDITAISTVVIDNNEFIRNTKDKAKSLIYFNEIQQVLFNFRYNSINLTGNINSIANAVVFYSEQAIHKYSFWTFDKNCLIQNDDYPLEIKNEIFNPPISKWENAFVDECTTFIPTPSQTPDQADNLPDNIFHDGNCNLDHRCHFEAGQGNQICVFVWISQFSGFIENDDNGGALNVVDCGLQCNETTFTNCESTNGCGGAIYYRNSLEFENNLTFIDLQFIECKAVYGGAVYIYSSSENSNVTINKCAFRYNQAISQNSDTEPFGGNSIFLTSNKFYITNCSFHKGKGAGGSVKIYNVFDSNSKSIKHDIENTFLISNCDFNNDKDYVESIQYISYNNNNNTKIYNSFFNGKLVENNFDDSKSSNHKSKVIIDSCTFNYDLQTTINIKSINYKSNSGSNEKISLKYSYLAFAAIGAILLACFILSKRKKETEHESDEKSLGNL